MPNAPSPTPSAAPLSSFSSSEPPPGWRSKHDRRLKVPHHRLRAYLPATPGALMRMARKRAQQRWSALLTRIAKQVRPALGDMLWDKFVAHAEAHYKDTFVRAFRAPRLRCVGPPRGGSCPRRFEVDLTSPRAYLTLGELHLDHEQDVLITCDMWLDALAALPHGPGVWDDGVDRALLCHLLFGVCDDAVHGRAMVRFRCGPAHGRSSAHHCHQLNMPHYRGLRDVRV